MSYKVEKFYIGKEIQDHIEIISIGQEEYTSHEIIPVGIKTVKRTRDVIYCKVPVKTYLKRGSDA